MPYFETPRGANNKNVVNPGEEHLACVIAIDTSGSMEKVRVQLINALCALGEAIKEDPQAIGTVEICIITFDDVARVVVPFGPSYEYEVPEIQCGGCTAMYGAIDLALGELAARNRQYEAANTPYKRGWFFMATDGCATDEDNGTRERLIEAQKNKHCTFFSIGIGEDADIDFLKSLRPDGMTFKASKQDFQDAFVWLSNSLSVTSASQKDQKVVLPPLPQQIVVDA